MPDDRTGPNLGGPTLESEAARQGESTGRMRNVLHASLILAILVIGGVTVWWIASHRPAERPPVSTSAGSVGPIGAAPNATPTPVSPSGGSGP